MINPFKLSKLFCLTPASSPKLQISKLAGLAWSHRILNYYWWIGVFLFKRAFISVPFLICIHLFPMQFPTEPQKSSSMRLHAERIEDKESEQNPTKSKSFLKSLLTRRRSRKDDMLYSYLDEYWCLLQCQKSG